MHRAGERTSRSESYNQVCTNAALFVFLSSVLLTRHKLVGPCSQLKEDARRAKTSAAEYSDLQAQLEDAERRSSDLRRQLTERSAECRELGSLRKEVEDLRAVTKNQELCLAQSRRAAQQSQAEATSLEAILSLLHLREVGRSLLSASPDFPCQWFITHLLNMLHKAKVIVSASDDVM